MLSYASIRKQPPNSRRVGCGTHSKSTQAEGAPTMRQFPVAVAAAGLLVAACDGNGGGAGDTPDPKPSPTTSKQALAPAVLPDLLLGPSDVDSALGVTGWRTD